jgi:hypothetical protein
LNPAERLNVVVAAMESVGLRCLVMGGHAVRYYGLERYTNDFDLALAPDGCDELRERLATTSLFPAGGPTEGISWRPGQFRRFLLDTRPDGQQEWLEFWIRNHLLAPFSELFERKELGNYGAGTLPFLSLEDLIQSKQTERAKDWDDISYLEEFLDARLHARCAAGEIELANALSHLRSRRGFARMMAESRLGDTSAVSIALSATTNPVTQAFLLPLAPAAHAGPTIVTIEPLVERKLRSAAPGSALHLTLVEVVRRQYKVFCQDLDRADKQAVIASQQQRR